jgi:carboxymethylenebutenolidase
MTSTALQEKNGVLAGFVSYPGPKGTLSGYLARPTGTETHPGVILVQEWWGIELQIKDMTERLAREGFVVLAPDLYHGTVVDEPSAAEKEMMALNKESAVGEIQHAIRYLQDKPFVAPKKLGMTGFCMGGFLTWLTAERDQGQLAAIAPFYGGFYEPKSEDVAKIQVPVLAVWGDHDPSIPPEARNHIVSLLKQHGKSFETLVLPAGHAFMRDHGPNYKPDAARQAWAALLTFFKKHLG